MPTVHRCASRFRRALLPFLLCLAAARASGATTLVVTSRDDTDDGLCGEGHCTLREALVAANSRPGHDDILFLIRPLDQSVKTIVLLSPLPLLSDPAGVTINALTQTGSHPNTSSAGSTDARLLVELDGSLAGIPANGLVVGGGPSRIEGLVINRFSGSGMQLAVGSGHEVANTFIGTDATGTTALPNGDDGITVLVPACRLRQNLISGNDRDGVQLSGEGTGTSLEANLIGVNAAGASVLGNRRAGVAIFTGGNQIGGLASGTGNYIGGNLDVGLVCVTSDAHDNVVQGNVIFDNRSHGVMITVDAARNTVARVGGFPQPSNTILRNGGNGVCVTESAGTPNPVLPFRVEGNELIGIDYTGGEEDEFGVTPNDPLDADDGPNGLQNAPVLLDATTDGTSTSVEGDFSGEPFEDLVISFYAGLTCHPSGHGDGRLVGGGFVSQTDAEGESRGRAQVDAFEGEFVSALAIDGDGNSSEFSNCIQVVFGPTATAAPTRTATPLPRTATLTPTVAGPTVTSTAREATPSATEAESTPTVTPPPMVDTATPTPEDTMTATPGATETPTAEALPGDANCDGGRSVADVVAVQGQIAEERLVCGGDVDDDGQVTQSDLTALLRILF